MQQVAAGRFEPHVPEGFHEQKRKILYIGKATAGEFGEADAVAWSFENMQSPFWRFADRLSQLADPNIQGRANLAWSNIFKQGVKNGNPQGEVALDQAEESVQLLKEEVTKLRPDLIVLVTADYWEEIPKKAFDIADGESTQDADGKLKTVQAPGGRYGIWSRPSFKSFPPIVWLHHPQGKMTEYLDAAIAEVSRLTGWTGDAI